jgi:hypothetical protein|tara:strand:- start:9579 stop:9749 length:171 start_codon:yes stop_codon:yes gene_type:complete
MSSSKKIRISDVHGNHTYVDLDELVDFYKKQKKFVEKLEKQIKDAEIDLRKEEDEK